MLIQHMLSVVSDADKSFQKRIESPRPWRTLAKWGALAMVSLSLIESPEFSALEPRERLAILFGERTESHAMSNKPQGLLWVTLVEAYQNRLETNRASKLYQDNVRRTLARFTEARNLWNSRVDQITQADLENYVNLRSVAGWTPPGSKRESRPLSAVTINNEIAILNSIFAYAGPKLPMKGHRDNLGIVADAPFFRPLGEPEPMPVSIDEQQLEDFIASARYATSPRQSVCNPEHFWLATLVLDSITALRRGALLSIIRPDDHTLLVKRQLTITTQQSKNKRAEVITLGTRDDVVHLLAALPSKPGEPLLPWKTPAGKRLSLSHFNCAMKKFQVAAGISESRVLKTKHLRSTAATEILAEQFSTDTARKRLGHKSENVIRKHYQARIVNEADKSASDFLAARVMNLLNRPRPSTLPMIG